MKLRFIVVLATLAGCSTVQTRRADPPVLQQATTQPLAAIQGCLSDTLAKQDVRYLPRANGGTFTTSVGLYRNWTPWVIDVEDLGSERRVTLFAADTISGPDKGLIAKVRACL